MNKITAVIAIASCAGIASANYVQNGSFENPNLGGGWSEFWSIPGWYAENNAASASVQPIEIGAGSIYGVNGYDGLQVLELNSNAPSTVSQNIGGLVSGNWYMLSFAYGQRAGDAVGQDNFNVDWNGSIIASYVPTSSTMTIATLLIEGGGADKLSFEGTGYSGYGGIIDNAIVGTPAPAAVLPFIVGFAARLRRRNRR